MVQRSKWTTGSRLGMAAATIWTTSTLFALTAIEASLGNRFNAWKNKMGVHIYIVALQ
jgi:hypothetical protein